MVHPARRQGSYVHQQLGGSGASQLNTFAGQAQATKGVNHASAGHITPSLSIYQMQHIFLLVFL
jgi:hypothetical protein